MNNGGVRKKGQSLRPQVDQVAHKGGLGGEVAALERVVGARSAPPHCAVLEPHGHVDAGPTGCDEAKQWLDGYNYFRRPTVTPICSHIFMKPTNGYVVYICVYVCIYKEVALTNGW